MQFSVITDADLRRATSRRNSPDLSLEEEFTAEELIEFHKRVDAIDAHKGSRTRAAAFWERQKEANLVIEARVEARRQAEDRKASFEAKIPSLAIRTQKLEDEDEWFDSSALDRAFLALEVTQLHAVCTDRQQLAAWLGSDPHDIAWNTLVQTLFVFRDGKRYVTPELAALVQECLASGWPAGVWNERIAAMEPSTLGGIRYGEPAFYMDPSRPESSLARGMQFQPKAPDSNAETDDWMVQAALHNLPDRITKCEYSHKTLVDSGMKGGNSYWRIAPHWQGMSLGMARLAVTYAAIVAGVAEGVLSGKAPAVVYRLAADGDAWVALALATKHPEFYGVAKALMAMRDGLYFSLDDPDIRANIAAYERAAKLAAKEETHE